MQPKHLLALAVLAASATMASAQQQGISKNEILLGTIQDLSGPLAGYGKQARNGMLMAIEEVNEQGGIQGRKIKLLVEDSGYDPKKAVLATQKLVNQDKIFMMVGHLGTAHNMAAMPVQFEKNVINFMPLSAAREMYEPFHKLKYSFAGAYYDQIRYAVPKLVKEKDLKKVCTLYQDDDFGLEVLKGGEAGLKALNMSYAEKTSYKRGATDFSSQIQKLQASNCDMVVLGTIIRETIGAIGTARKMGYNPVFLGSSAAYTDLIHRLGGKAMDGFYAAMTVQNPYTDDTSQPIRFWANKYKTKFNEDPAVFSVYGYLIITNFANAATKAGKNLTTESFIKSMDSLSIAPDIFGGPSQQFSPTRHLGSDAARLSQIQDGKWKPVSDYFGDDAKASAGKAAAKK